MPAPSVESSCFEIRLHQLLFFILILPIWNKEFFSLPSQRIQTKSAKGKLGEQQADEFTLRCRALQAQWLQPQFCRSLSSFQ